MMTFYARNHSKRRRGRLGFYGSSPIRLTPSLLSEILRVVSHVSPSVRLEVDGDDVPGL